MKPFTDARRTVWLAGISLLVLGFLAAAIYLPSTSADPLESGPDIHLPKMQNVPPPESPKMKVELEAQTPKEAQK